MESRLDGVGDYTLNLAEELAKLGNHVSIVAFHDKFITSQRETMYAVGDCGSLQILRIPAISSSMNRMKIIEQFLQDVNPEWVSLQFVSFGYHKYGLPFELVFSLPRVLKNKKTHIMFHELWCGMGEQPGKKEQLLGFIQKIFFKLMISVLHPDVIFTNTESYARHLGQIGF